MNKKNCFYCESKIIFKYGFARGKQRYKCQSCGKQFVGGHRIDANKLWVAYCQGQRIYKQVGVKYNCSTKTIQRKIDEVKVEKAHQFESVANILMDTTYFGHTFGVMVIKGSLSGKCLFHLFEGIPVQMCQFYQVQIINVLNMFFESKLERCWMLN